MDWVTLKSEFIADSIFMQSIWRPRWGFLNQSLHMSGLKSYG